MDIVPPKRQYTCVFVDILLSKLNPVKQNSTQHLEDGRLMPGRLDEAVGRVLEVRGVDPCDFEWE